MQLSAWLRETSSAFADLGTFLPLAVGLIVIAGVNASGLLFGFGLFAIATGVIYRCPIPVQPMKAVAAMGIAGLAGPDVLIATSVLLGLTLLVFSTTNLITHLKRLIPNTLLYGLRLALALTMIATVVDNIEFEILGAFCLLALLGLIQLTRLRALSCLLVLIIGYAVLGTPISDPMDAISLTLPVWNTPDLASYSQALSSTYIPQLVLTITNALILTTVIASEYFPDKAHSFTERKLALTSGAANLCLAPFGAIPMCHGAGGLSAHYGMGSRTGWSIGLFGVICLIGALFLGDHATAYMQAIPSEAVIVLVLFSSWVLADPVKIIQLKRSCQVIIAVMAITVLITDLLTGLALGFVLEALWGRHLKQRKAAQPGSH